MKKKIRNHLKASAGNFNAKTASASRKDEPKAPPEAPAQSTIATQ